MQVIALVYKDKHVDSFYVSKYCSHQEMDWEDSHGVAKDQVQDEPPSKLYISHMESGERILHSRSDSQRRELPHKGEKSKHPSLEVRGFQRLNAVVNHPTERHISQILSEFALNFLHNGYSSLVHQLVEVSGSDSEKPYFFWLLTYFLKVATQLKIGVGQIGKVQKNKKLKS